MLWILLVGAMAAVGTTGLTAGISIGRRIYAAPYQAAHARAPRPLQQAPAAELPAGPDMGTPYGIPQWTAPLADHTAWAMQTAEPFGYDQPRAARMQASAVSQHQALDAHARAGQLLEPAPDDTLVLITSMRATAERQAAQLTQQASEQAAATRAAAERQAAQLTRQASDQAAATRAAAERELWNAAMALLGELNRVREDGTGDVTDVTELAAPPAGLRWPEPAAPPGAMTPAAAGARPATHPGATPPAAAGEKPATQPGARSAAPPAAKAAARTRQFIAARLTVTVIATLVVLVAVAGSAEVALHGFAFFAFRSAGTGATDDKGLQENQGPGQPDAPGAHGRAHQTTPGGSHG